MEENRVERRIVMRVEEIGGKAYKWNPLGIKGAQDRIVLLPGGRTIFVELKAPGEKPRKLQKYRAKELRKLGFQVECLDTVEKVDLFIKEIVLNV